MENVAPVAAGIHKDWQRGPTAVATVRGRLAAKVYFAVQPSGWMRRNRDPKSTRADRPVHVRHDSGVTERERRTVLCGQLRAARSSYALILASLIPYEPPVGTMESAGTGTGQSYESGRTYNDFATTRGGGGGGATRLGHLTGGNSLVCCRRTRGARLL